MRHQEHPQKTCKKRNVKATKKTPRTQEAKWQKTKRKNAEDEWANEDM